MSHHRKQIAGEDLQIARRARSRRHDKIGKVQILRSPALDHRHPAVLSAKAAARASIASPRLVNTHAASNDDRAAETLNDIRDPGWVMVAGMAVFFAVTAIIIALT
jgi:hypothetical protein